MKRLLAFFLAAVMVFGMMAGCGNGSNSDTQPKDPAAETTPSGMEGMTEDEILKASEEMLADSWEHNEDYTVWTFHIREGLKWIDHTGAETGYDVTAQDFVGGLYDSTLYTVFAMCAVGSVLVCRD